MVTIPLRLPDELAKQVLPLQDRLPEIIALGLKHWQEEAPLTPRERVEQLWDSAGVLVPLPGDSRRPKGRPRRRKPISAPGQPASEIIIEQRGEL